VSAPEVVGLLVAKAPVPGLAKTRLAAHVGDRAAAELAAAALLDTLEALTAAFPTVHVSLTGDVEAAVRADEIAAALSRCEVSQQHGPDFGARLAHAHACAGGAGRLVVQVGMDTPQVSPDLLRDVAAMAGDDRRTAVLGPADDGGWWVLALHDPALAAVLAAVPLSRKDTAELTERALCRAGAAVRRAARLRDVDEIDDAQEVARAARHSRFAATWELVASEPPAFQSSREAR
jgi:uncharacterized protein